MRWRSEHVATGEKSLQYSRATDDVDCEPPLVPQIICL